MASLLDIDGLSAADADRLQAVGIDTTDRLLERAGTANGRWGLSIATGLERRALRAWARRADLARVSGIGPAYAHLLETAGVEGAADLATRDPEALADRLATVNDEHDVVAAAPSAGRLATWIDRAGELEA
jgi:predicted RecB family nuclease